MLRNLWSNFLHLHISVVIIVMKRFYLISLLIIRAINSFSQDTLVLRNGDISVIKLIEINPENLRYRQLDYPDGPVFTVKKEEVKFVVYKTGRKENFEGYVAPKSKNSAEDISLLMSGRFFYYKEKQIKEPDMLSVIFKYNDKTLNKMGKKIENLRFIKNVFLIGGIGAFMTGLYQYRVNAGTPGGGGRGGRGGFRGTPANTSAQNSAKLVMLGGLVSEVICISIEFDKRIHDRLLVDAYNKKIIER